jgi:hypothetical protein
MLPLASIFSGLSGPAAETIRQIALYTNKTGDKSLTDKIRSGFEVAGLYPHIIKTYDIQPDGMTPEQIKSVRNMMSGPYGHPAVE